MNVPKGFRLVYNRLNEEYERMFDGRPYVFKAHETVMLPQEDATFLSEASIFSYDPVLASVKRVLALDGEEEFEKPLEEGLPIELIDRSNDPEPFVKRGSEDGPRHTEYVKVKGAVEGGTDPLLKRK